MWIFTAVGCFSIVQEPGQDRSFVTVRARFRGDLEMLRQTYFPELGPVRERGGTDALYQAVARRPACAAALARIALDLDYGSLTDAVALRQGHERAALYRQAWDVVARTQPWEQHSDGPE